MSLAIIIPTLNEESYIGKLLDSIAAQTMQPQEIVVVDVFSKDQTKKEVEKRKKILAQLQFFQIPKYTISRQRNFGVTKTKSPNLLFLDADVVLKDPKTLEIYIAEIEDKKPDLASASNLPLSGYWKDAVVFLAADVTFRLTKPIWPMAQGINIYCKRSFFEKIQGFDEHLKFAEDHEFIQRGVANGGKFLFLNSPKIYTSTRRLAYEGRIRYSYNMILSFFHIIHKGYHKNPLNNKYEFGHFK